MSQFPSCDPNNPVVLQEIQQDNVNADGKCAIKCPQKDDLISVECEPDVNDPGKYPTKDIEFRSLILQERK